MAGGFDYTGHGSAWMGENAVAESLKGVIKGAGVGELGDMV